MVEGADVVDIEVSKIADISLAEEIRLAQRVVTACDEEAALILAARQFVEMQRREELEALQVWAVDFRLLDNKRTSPCSH